MAYQTLIIFSSTDGQTQKISHTMQQKMASAAHQVQCVELTQVNPTLLQNVQQIILGASIRYGKFKPSFYKFINTYSDILQQKESAFFCVNLVARKVDKSTPKTNPYMKKQLEKMSWTPKHLAVFAGVLNYPAYGLLDKNMIRLIMWMTGGPTNTKASYEFTNWKHVEHFANQLCEPVK